MQPIRLFEGDSLDVLATIPDHTYTAVITDPPYGLSTPPDPVDVITQWLLAGDFRRDGRGRKKAPPPGLSELAARFASTSGPGGMLGFKWDAFVPGPRLWREVFRVCKPGAIVLAFAGTRTQHWMALSLVLAGFEVIDCIGHIQSQGMAKAGTVDKRIDRRRHDRDQVLACTAWIRRRCEELGLKPADLDAACGTAGMGGHWVSSKSQPYIPTREQWTKLEPLLGPMPPEIDAQRMIIDARQPGPDHFKREVIGTRDKGSQRGGLVLTPENCGFTGHIVDSLPATDLSGEWAGWSTQLGPALEPIIVARKPCEGTAVENILRYGCGAMNIDACRIGYEVAEREVVDNRSGASTPSKIFGPSFGGGVHDGGRWKSADGGRWPKNAMFCEESAAVLDAQVGERKSGGRRNGARQGMGFNRGHGDGGPAIEGPSGDASRFFAVIPDDPPSDKGGAASRFFWVGPLATDDDVALPVRYVPKASRRERNAGLPPGAKGDHPTKKPRKLMEWLCRLAGHPKGRILDPFAGSGSTLAAARAMGLPCGGVGRGEHYCRDLAAPPAGVAPADVVRVPPPSDADRPLDAAPRVPYYETVRPPRPPVTFPIAYSAGVPVTAPSAPAPALSPVAAPRVTEDTPPPVPSLEIPAPAQADASYGLPPMFPRLPGAPEVP